MHVAGAVHQDVGRAVGIDHLLGHGVDRVGRQRVEREGLVGLQRLQLRRIEIGGDHVGAFGDEPGGDGPADALPRRSDEGALAAQTSGHCFLLDLVIPDAAQRRPGIQ